MDSPRYSYKWVMLIAALMLIAVAIRLTIVSRDHLAARFDLAFESPNLSTIKALDSGRNIYDPAIYEKPPFILTLYTPAYHYLVSWLPKHPENPFFTGRVVSLFFMVAAALCLFLPKRALEHVFFSALAFSTFFVIREIVSHTAYLRNDSMGLFFSAASIVVAERSKSRPWCIAVTAVATWIAFTAKQSYLAAALACFFYYTANTRRAGFQFALFSAAAIGAFGLLVVFLWGEGFWFSIFVAPRNPFMWQYFSDNITRMLQQPLFGCIFILSLTTSVLALRNKKADILKESPYFLYYLFSWVVLFATVGKEGANVNYFFEPILASLLWLVHFSGPSWPIRRFSVVSSSVVAIAIFVVLELAVIKRDAYSFSSSKRNQQMRHQLDMFKKDIKALFPEKPKVLNMAWAGLSFEIQDDPHMNDLFLYSILWNTQVLDIKPLLQQVVEQEYDIIILRKDQYLKKDFITPYDYLIGTTLSAYKLAKNKGYYFLVPKSVHL